jgi:Na+-driven multidrug efflux pump
MIFSTTVTFSAFVVGLHWGVAGVAGSLAVARTIVLFANTWLMCRTIELSVVRTVRSYLEVAWMAGLMGLIVYITRVGFVHAGLPAALRLVLLTMLGACVYFALVARYSPDLVLEVRTTLQSRRSARPA